MHRVIQWRAPTLEQRRTCCLYLHELGYEVGFHPDDPLIFWVDFATASDPLRMSIIDQVRLILQAV